MDVQTISTGLATLIIMPSVQWLKKRILYFEMPLVVFVFVGACSLGLSWVAHYAHEPVVLFSPEHIQATIVMSLYAIGMKVGWKTYRRIWPGEKSPEINGVKDSI